MKPLTNAVIMNIVIASLCVAVYVVIALMLITDAKANKVGVGNFVMAVSYTESYDDLQYVAHFADCDKALDYYNQNCVDASIMMCQLEQYMYMPIGFKSDVSFDFEPTDKQSCGFVGVQKNQFTEVK